MILEFHFVLKLVYYVEIDSHSCPWLLRIKTVVVSLKSFTIFASIFLLNFELKPKESNTEMLKLGSKASKNLLPNLSYHSNISEITIFLILKFIVNSIIYHFYQQFIFRLHNQLTFILYSCGWKHTRPNTLYFKVIIS